MKTCIKKSFFLSVLMLVALGSVLAGRVTAQTFTTLYNFTNGIDGGAPLAGLVLSGNTLYGTASAGGAFEGTVFAIKTDGTGFTILHSFTATPGYTNSDGYRPCGGLLLSSNILYGTAYYGGRSANGTVFALNADGTGFTTLYSFSALNNFTNSDGANPYAGLALSGKTLYGTTYKGGSSRLGTVFALNTDGSGFTTLHTFKKDGSEGGNPYAGLVVSGNTLYGQTSNGGSGSGGGTVFALNTNGTGFTVLHNFNSGDTGNPFGALILASNTLYGTTAGIVSGTVGTVFALNTNGTGFTILHSFTNSDGADPFGGLILSGNTLYGTTRVGGSNNSGTVFAVNTDGTGFMNLHDFYSATDGWQLMAGLTLSDHTLYGTADSGGSGNLGTVFRLSLSVSQPQITVIPSGTNITLSWPTNFIGFFLQDTTDLMTGGWISTTLPQPPSILNGQFVVTIPKPTSGRHFYRLSQ